MSMLDRAMWWLWWWVGVARATGNEAVRVEGVARRGEAQRDTALAHKFTGPARA